MAKEENNNTHLNEITRVSSGTEVKGILTSKTDIRIDGRFEGNIVTKGKLVIGEKAFVTNSVVVCQSADLWGTIEGDIFVSDVLSLKNSSSFSGDLNVPKLTIDVGAKFNGKCKVITEQEFASLTKEFWPEEDKAAPVKK